MLHCAQTLGAEPTDSRPLKTRGAPITAWKRAGSGKPWGAMSCFRYAFGALALSLVACNDSAALSPGPSSGIGQGPAASRLPHHGRTGSQQIQHVVIIMQENRSFNNLFMNFPGATTATYGYDHKNRKRRGVLHSSTLGAG